MPKRQKYKIGDIIEIPLNDHLTGFARILHKEEDILLLECFDLKREKIILSKRCWNDSLKNGKWKVIDYLEVPSDYPYPVLYGQSAITDKYYKINTKDFLRGLDYELESRVYIDEKELVHGDWDSITSGDGIVELYLEKLMGGND